MSPSGTRNAAASVMRYGVVITVGSAEAGEAGADDEDFPADGKGSGRVGPGLRHVRVKLTPGRIDTMLSTQVCFVTLRYNSTNRHGVHIVAVAELGKCTTTERHGVHGRARV